MANVFDKKQKAIKDITVKAANDIDVNPFMINREPRRDKISIAIPEDLNQFITSFSELTDMSKSEVISIILKLGIKHKYVVEVIGDHEDLQELYKLLID